MILTADNVIDYLGARGLPACPPIVASPSRNRNFSASPAGGGAGFFLKQLRVLAPESVRMMQREATVYWLSRNDEDFAALRDLIPPFVLFDGSAKVLVLGLLPGSGDQEDFSILFAEGLGRSLAAVHRRVGLRMRSDPAREAFPREVPGIFTAHRGGPLVQWLGPGQMRLIDQVRGHPLLSTALDRLAAGWCFDTFVHGDLKFENCVFSFRPGAEPRVRIVDWELADFGDPCWDAGCVVQAYLWVCLRPGLATREYCLEERLDREGERSAAMRAALGAFWQQYLISMETSPNLERFLGCTAARLIQMALEVMHGLPEPSPAALSLVETAEEILSCPARAAVLLGL